VERWGTEGFEGFEGFRDLRVVIVRTVERLIYGRRRCRPRGCVHARLIVLQA